MKQDILINLLNILFLFIAPFFIIGMIKKTKSFFAGKKGVSIFQPIYDFVRLLKKDRVISNTTTLIFNLSPVVIFVSTITAALFVPMIMGKAIINVEIGVIIFSYLLGFGKFFSLISAMDTGSSFEGMGASREACFTTIIEPAFFIIMASIIVLSGNFTMEGISTLVQSSGMLGVMVIILAVVALLIMLLVECSRIPVDDPTTHLELTMIHEVMELDNSGIDLALITYASGMKMFILGSLIINLILPMGMNFKLNIILFIVLIMLLSIAIGVIESMMARLRMSHVFEFVFVMSSIALVVASLAIVKMFGV